MEGRQPNHRPFPLQIPQMPWKTWMYSQERKSVRRMSRKTATWSVERPPATLRNVELLSRLALHHAKRAYFADDLQEG